MKSIKLGVSRSLAINILPIAILFFSALCSADHRTVKVVTEYLAPYQIKNDDGSLGGFSTDVINALFDQTQDQANIHVLPWARAYEMARTEPNVMIYSIAHTSARSAQFQWVGSLKKERLYFWGLKSRFSAPVDDYNTLKHMKVAASRYSNVAEFLENETFKNIYHLIKEDQNMLMLYRQRVDLIVATELTLITRAKKLGLDFDKIIKLKEVSELNNDLCIAFNLQSSPELVQQYKEAFTKLATSGALQKLKDKWQITDAQLIN